MAKYAIITINITSKLKDNLTPLPPTPGPPTGPPQRPLTRTHAHFDIFTIVQVKFPLKYMKCDMYTTDRQTDLSHFLN